MNKSTTPVHRLEEVIRILRELDISFSFNEFCSLPSIFSRLPFPRSKAALASWFMNLSQRKMFRGQESRTNFDGV